MLLLLSHLTSCTVVIVAEKSQRMCLAMMIPILEHGGRLLCSTTAIILGINHRRIRLELVLLATTRDMNANGRESHLAELKVHGRVPLTADRRRLLSGIGLEFTRRPIILVLLELLQLLNVQERIEIILHVGNLLDEHGAVTVDNARATIVGTSRASAAAAVQTAARRDRGRLVTGVVEHGGLLGYHSGDGRQTVAGGGQLLLTACAEGARVLVVGLLILADDATNVVGLIATLRVVEARVGMRNVDVNEVGEKEAQKGHTGQAAVHVHVTILALVVGRVEHEIGEAFERARVTFGDVRRPGAFETPNGRGLECNDDGHERVERVQFVETFGDLDKVNNHFATLLDSFACENLQINNKYIDSN